MIKPTNRFMLDKDWLHLGYKIVFTDNSETIVYDHDKNYRYWAENIRRSPNTDRYGGGHTPPWIIKMNKK